MKGKNGKPLTDPCIIVNRCAISGLIIGLTTGAIVGIIFAGILAGALLGGGTYAATQAFAAEPTSNVENNPLYQSSSLNAENPLFGVGESAP